MKKFLLSMLLMLLTTASAVAQTAYATYEFNSSVLTFSYGEIPDNTSGKISWDVSDIAAEKRDWSSIPWYHWYYGITKVVFSPEFKNARPKSTAYWFAGCQNLKDIVGIEYLNTSNVTSMKWMFYGCSGLNSLDLSFFDTSNVTDMNSMFSYCKQFTSFDLSNFDTSRVTDMNSMFRKCSGLTSLDLSNFDTGNVLDMGYMFENCNALIHLDLSNFDANNVFDMGHMFDGCSSLISLDLSSFCTTNAVDMKYMFCQCTELVSLDISNFITTHVTDMSNMFRMCRKLSNLDLSNFNTCNVVKMVDMFFHCDRLTVLNVSSFNTVNVTDMEGIFRSCSSLTNLDVINFITSNVTNMYGMFIDCSSLISLDLSNFETSNVTNMGHMFAGCKRLATLDISNFDTRNVTSMIHMFAECGSLNSLDVSNFDTRSVTNMNAMFENCSSLSFLDLSNFVTSNVTEMNVMFNGCKSLNSLDLSNFDTRVVTRMDRMFNNCPGLISLDLSSFDTQSVKWLNNMFSYCPNLICLDLSNFDTRNVTKMENMFAKCSSLKTIYCSYQWNTKNVESSTEMFLGCNGLVGGAGTAYDENHVDGSYAHVDGGPSNPGYLTYKGSTPKVADSDDLQAFIDGLLGNGDKGTAVSPKVIPVSDEGLTIDKDVNIEDDLQLLIDGQTDNHTVIYFPNYSALNINNNESSWQFNNSTLTSSAAASAKIMGVASNDSWGGINNQGKLTFAASTFENGNYEVKNLPSGILTLKDGTAVNGQQNIVNSGTLYTDGTCAINGIGNKQGGRIHLTAQPTQSVSIMIIETSDVEEGQPIVSGSDGYTLTEADAANITLTVPDDYECNYDAAQNALVVTSTNGITTFGTKAETVETYDLTGRKTTSTKKGLCIQRMSNGSVKKVIVK